MGEFIVGFSTFLDIQMVLVAAFYGDMHAIEETKKMGLISLWLECDSTLVCATFTTRTNVPWILRNRWNTCLDYYGKIKFRISHIFHEVNAYADKFANLLVYPSSLFLKFFINRYRLPKYRFS